jgi:hypothetical protein
VVSRRAPDPAPVAAPTRLRWSILKPGQTVDQRRIVSDVVQGAVMHRAVLQMWAAYPDANDDSVPAGRWVDLEVGDEGQ